MMSFAELNTATTAIATLSGAVCAVVFGLYKIYSVGKKIYSQLAPGDGENLSSQLAGIRDDLNVMRDRQWCLWDNMPIPYFECYGAEGHCVYVNKALTMLFGLSREQMVESGWLAAIPSQEQRHKVIEAWQYAVRHNLPYDEHYEVKHVVTGELSNVRAISDAPKEKKKIHGDSGSSSPLRQEQSIDNGWYAPRSYVRNN